ncbi:Hint domain-containing protein [Roseovarius azorensis]|uniref:Hint domain-containing protein n=1 Tax=Roseovarius azorensis TaxID=1287727 RepID=A0A1H7NWK2_9RHOB|nr:Hint domain-containing protein [Roseovarius azorensis]SEL27378.1 Hint domain-containing protein [Roseovarius azorensis]
MFACPSYVALAGHADDAGFATSYARIGPAATLGYLREGILYGGVTLDFAVSGELVVEFTDGERQALGDGSLVQLTNGDLFFAPPSGAFAQGAALRDTAGRAREIIMAELARVGEVLDRVDPGLDAAEASGRMSLPQQAVTTRPVEDAYHKKNAADSRRPTVVARVDESGGETVFEAHDDDSLYGGAGVGAFISVRGHAVTGPGAHPGWFDDGGPHDYDFVHLSGTYNQEKYQRAVSLGLIDPAEIRNPLEWLRSDHEQDGILNTPITDRESTTTPNWHASDTLSASSMPKHNTEDVLCFSRGTHIATAQGEVPVEDLIVGDRVITRDRGYQRILWIGSATHRALGTVAPVLIRRGALDNQRDLLVSPDHKVLLVGPAAELVTGENEVLVPARFLVDGHDVIQRSGGVVEYFHILFENHELILSEGCWTESFHPGNMNWSMLRESTRTEMFKFFPDLARQLETQHVTSARRVLDCKEAHVVLHAMQGAAYANVQRLPC